MRQRICTRIGKCLQTIDINDIIRFAAEEKYVVAHTLSKSLCFEGTLKALEKEFSTQFIRLHRSHLVRTELITDLRWCRYLASVGIKGSNIRVPVSRARVTQVQSEIRRRSHANSAMDDLGGRPEAAALAGHYRALAEAV